MLGLRLMGKRQIGELEPAELVLTMLLSDLAAVPMQNFGIPLLNGVVPILTLLCMTMIFSYLNMKSIRFRRLACGQPTVLVENGKLLQEAMRKNRFTIDELLEQFRIQGIHDWTTVKYAILETGGQLSVLLYEKEQPLTPSRLGFEGEDSVSLPRLLINDGRLCREELRRSGQNEAWLKKQLQQRGLSSVQQVFLFSLSEEGRIICIPKEELNK